MRDSWPWHALIPIVNSEVDLQGAQQELKCEQDSCIQACSRIALMLVHLCFHRMALRTWTSCMLAACQLNWTLMTRM